ncbi:MAG: DUF1822 family protein [Cyanobacteria bacterium P01_C01_bin.72]
MIMNPPNPEIEDFAISLPITTEIWQMASQFASRQPTPAKAEQIRLNTIAVLVTNNYLNMLDVATDLANSDSLNPIMQVCGNGADLELREIGKLECRPIKSSDTTCQIPLEVWDLRIGYVVVRIEEDFKSAAILGFTAQVATEELAIADLEPPEALIDRLHESPESVMENALTNLGQWFNDVIETGWQSLDNLLNSDRLTPAYGFRSIDSLDSADAEQPDDSITKVKLIDLGVQVGDRQVILLVKLEPEADNNIGVTLQVLPQINEIHLPENLELKVLDSSSLEVFMETRARSRDNYVQLQFSGQPGEMFEAVISLGGVDFSEQFQL